LFVTAAHWYAELDKPKAPGAFFEELADWGEATDLAAVDRGDEPGEANPIVGFRERFVRDWPGPARPDDADDVFPQGGGARRSRAGRSPRGVARGRRGDAVHARGRAAPDARDAPARAGPGRARGAGTAGTPTTVSVSGSWTTRLPEAVLLVGDPPPAAVQRSAARRGTRVHAWIERRSIGQETCSSWTSRPTWRPRS
jgi:hypothetical protein